MWTCSMKSLIWRFVTDQSGALSFEDGLTIFSLTIGFIAALALMNSSLVQLFALIFGMLPGSR
jgi:Flp pilus assembly pilin Flp